MHDPRNVFEVFRLVPMKRQSNAVSFTCGPFCKPIPNKTPDSWTIQECVFSLINTTHLTGLPIAPWERYLIAGVQLSRVFPRGNTFFAQGQYSMISSHTKWPGLTKYLNSHSTLIGF